MTPKEAIEILNLARFTGSSASELDAISEALDVAIEALKDNKPSRAWIAKNEYRRGWHDAITKALSEVLKIYVGNEIFDMVQKETLIGLGLSMDSALGAEPYSDTEESYPEPDRPHGEWIPVSERLPEENKTVIASTEYGVFPEARYTKEDGWEWAYESGADYWEELEDVIAWMPLPEPYEEEGEAE